LALEDGTLILRDVNLHITTGISAASIKIRMISFLFDDLLSIVEISLILGFFSIFILSDSGAAGPLCHPDDSVAAWPGPVWVIAGQDRGSRGV
jgi:hypothetical protein